MLLFENISYDLCQEGIFIDMCQPKVENITGLYLHKQAEQVGIFF